MGLDTTHDCWHGAYSAFMRWRQMVAKVAGIPLALMEGFYSPPGGGDWAELTQGKDPLHGTYWPFGSHYKDTSEWLPIAWESLRPDPLHILLDHSDCDGEIKVENCGPIADRLEELLPKFPSTDGGGHIGNWKDKTAQFIKGLRKAASLKEAVEFQ